jgi:XTP/dITP diphosphohydrolase
MAQPALSLAAQLQRRAQSAGAPHELADLADLTDLAEAADGGADRADEGGSQREPRSAEQVSEIGVELFALVAKARAAGIDPELELRRAAAAYRGRFQAWERSTARP